MSKARPGYQRHFLTPADAFYEVTRGKPYLLPADARRQAGLDADTWRLELVPDEPPWQPTLQRTCRISDGTAVTLNDLETLFQARPVRVIKTMQCLMDRPSSGLCSNGLWEGVALRDVLARLGRLENVRRVFYAGFYEDPKQRFISSLALSEVLDTPPGHAPVMLAFRLNGRPLPLERGGPVRLLVPEAYGYKSIKWLNRVVLTNDYRANDTYAEKQNNDPQTPMKTLARLDIHLPDSFPRGEPVVMRGVVIVGQSGLQAVQYWLRPDQGTHGRLDPDDPAWRTAEWKPVALPSGPPSPWAEGLPDGRFPAGTLHVDSDRQAPAVWPLPFSWVPWTVPLEHLPPGAYEFRARAVDANGHAQPEPRPNPQSGIADIPCAVFVVS